jgi:agmatinase
VEDIAAVNKGMKPGMVGIIGVPTDENSSFMQGAALAPARIREALHAGAMNLSAENGIDLGSDSRWQDLGDLVLDRGATARQQIQATVASLLEHGIRVLSLGGDHAITYPIMRAYAARYDHLNILQLDAHPDLYQEYAGNRYSHACPFARIMEENLAARLVQVGIRTINPHLHAQIKRFGVEIVEMRGWRRDLELGFDGPLYISLDLDVLDPAFAPGVSHHEPGGMSTREVIGLIQGLEVPIIGADIVELNPKRDPLGITAMAGAKLLKEIVACMLASTPLRAVG